jgi:hypothetical protein
LRKHNIILPVSRILEALIALFLLAHKRIWTKKLYPESAPTSTKIGDNCC